MKKLFALLMATVLVLSLASCGKKEECILLFDNSENVRHKQYTVVNFDINGDKKDDEIKVSRTPEYYIEVKAGDSVTRLGHGEAYYIDKIYAIDLDTKKKGKELVIISEEISNDMMMRILKSDGDTFRLYEFESVDGYSGEKYLWDTLSVGYDPEVEFADGILKTSKRGRYGMWSVEAEYSFDGEKFTEIEMDERAVVKPAYDLDWVLIEPWCNEKEALQEGYTIAYADFENHEETPIRSDMTELKKGDWFKITKEDSKGFIYIEKKSGEKGWIYVGSFRDNREDVSYLSFKLAD